LREVTKKKKLRGGKSVAGFGNHEKNKKKKGVEEKGGVPNYGRRRWKGRVIRRR